MSGYSDPDTGRLILIGARLRGLVRQCGVPDSECEDCVQESWLALLNTHPDWTVEEPRTLAWLNAVAHNQALMFHRRLRNHPSQRVDDLDAMPFRNSFPQIDEENAPDRGYREIVSNLQACLKHLSEVNRQVVVQRAQLGLSYREIAEALGLTSEQVRLRFYRASRTLHDQCDLAIVDAVRVGKSL